MELRLARIGHQAHLRRHWWLALHLPYEAFFVMATARSGSALLIECLNQIPGVQSHWELLNRSSAKGPWYTSGRDKALKHLRLSFQTLTAEHRGCKLFLDQMARYELTPEVLGGAFPGAKFIILYRQSLAEQFASHQLARRTHQWHLHAGQRQIEVPMRIDPEQFRAYCERTRRAYGELIRDSWLAERAVLLAYEELSANPGRCLREKICPLLGVPAIEPVPRMRKQNKRPLAERVANYDEVAALVAGPVGMQQHVLGMAGVPRQAA